MANCVWKSVDEYFEAPHYETSCGSAQYFLEGTAAQNDYKYCPYCGHPITVKEEHADLGTDSTTVE